MARVMCTVAVVRVAGRAAGCGDQPGVQDGRVGAAAVADRGQPGAEAFGVSQSARSWVSKRVRNARLIGESMSANRPTAPGNTFCRWARSWLATATRWATRSLRARQVRRSAMVAGLSGDQGPQPGPVGAQRVGQHERVEPVVLVAGRAVPAAQVLDLVRADHHHGDPGGEQRVDDRAVGSFDGDLADPGAGQQRAAGKQPGLVVRDREPHVDLTSAGVHHRHRVIVAGPVDAGGDGVDGFFGQDVCGRLHVSLLAASPSGEAPSFRCRDVAAGSLTDRRSMALSPVDGRHVPGNRRVPRNSSWTSMRQALVAVTGGTSGASAIHPRSPTQGWCTSERLREEQIWTAASIVASVSE